MAAEKVHTFPPVCVTSVSSDNTGAYCIWKHIQLVPCTSGPVIVDEGQETYNVTFKVDGPRGEAAPSYGRTCRPRAPRIAGATGAFVAFTVLVGQIRDQRLGPWQAIQGEIEEQAQLCKNVNYAEGFRAFPEKREPKFSGPIC